MRCAWLPLAALACIVLLSAFGHPITGFARAGGNSATVTVSGNVVKEIHLVPACSGGALTIPKLVPDGTPKEATADCAITYGSNNDALGATLTVADASAGTNPGRDAMVCTTPSYCNASTLPDAGGNPMPVDSTHSGFGVRLANSSGSSTAVWTQNTSPAPAGQFYAVQDLPQTACQTSDTADGTCAFRFAAAASDTQSPGTYQAQVLFAAYAR